jgi:flagellar basal-body rod modification protein FlgD
MSTTPVTSSSSTASTNQLTNDKSMNMTSSDFIKMMLTQLQNQDPLDPTKSQDLLTQVSQIGQMQSNTQMQTTLTNLALQTQIGSAGNLIGKSVEGMDDTTATVKGLVTSIRVESNQVYLELDSGKTLQLGKVTSISGGTGTTTAGTTTAAGTTAATTQPTTAAA